MRTKAAEEVGAHRLGPFDEAPAGSEPGQAKPPVANDGSGRSNADSKDLAVAPAKAIRPQQLKLDLLPVEQLKKPRRRDSAASGMTLGPRLALSPDEAAAVLGVSRDYFDHHVIAELRIVRRGRRILVPLTELERWLDRAAARTAHPGR